MPEVSEDEARLTLPDPGEDDGVFVEVFAETVGVLEKAEIPYLLMGGMGSASYGRPRWTHDIDVFVRPEDALGTVRALESAGFDTEQTYPDWLFKAFKRDQMVDIIFKSTGGILVDDDMLARARDFEFGGVRARLIPPEDLVVIKAIVHDEHMPRHWHDALAIIGACHDIDWDYLHQRARRFGARRVLSLLIYATSNDLIVPVSVIEELFEAVYEA